MPSKFHPSLPVDAVLPQLDILAGDCRNLLLTAPTGSGKTTRAPLALLDAPWLNGRKILMLEPRRLAARAAARYMARTLGESVGETVGYRIRMDSKVSRKTRIEVVTEGILTRQLQSDPELKGVGLVIFDEFHERSLNADLGLALCLDVQQGLRDDLRLLVMSATLDVDPLTELLDARIIRAEGRSYPVDLMYSTPKGELSIVDNAVRGVFEAVNEYEGDVLVFLPGVGEIKAVESTLNERLDPAVISVCPLYGDLDAAAQDRAIRPGDKRRVVLATSIAETSLTIEGVKIVVDSGWSRLPQFDPNTGMSRLTTQRVSRAAAEQRRGRAGRLEAGVCFRLWPETLTLAGQNDPEILQADLAPLMLELALWGVDDAASLQWLDTPPKGSISQAKELLQGLEALDDKGRISALGRRMAALPIHPRLAHMLLRGADAGMGRTAADLAALLSERDIFRRARDRQPSRDIEERLGELSQRRGKNARRSRRADVDENACRRVARISRQLASQGGVSSDDGTGDYSPGMLVALAFPDRIAQKRSNSNGQYLLANGRGALLAEEDPLCLNKYLAVAAMDAGKREGRIFLAAPLTLMELERLYPERIRSRLVVDWDSKRKAVAGRDERRFDALVLERKQAALTNSEQVGQVLLDALRKEGLQRLNWTKKATSLRTRIECLHEWDPDGGWPDLSGPTLTDTLEQWLGPWLDGASSFSGLQKIDLHTVLMQIIGWERAGIVDELTPERLTVPSGASHTLVYAPGEAPVLAVRLQEMFGQRATPTVCAGRVPVVLHLLSPARRPLQITRDLAGFWDRTYTEVKKEMKGRYPKHYWPDDPRAAVATTRVRPK